MALNAKQRAAAEMLVAEPEKSLADIAHQIGIDESTFWRWRKKPEFKEYEHELCHDRFLDLEKLAIKKLKENAMKNNQRAIEYLLNYIGYKPEEKINIGGGDIVVNITGDDDNS